MVRSTRIVAGFAAVLIVVGIVGMASYVNTQRLVENDRWVVHTHEVMENLTGFLSALKDAETGQRGFLLTGEEDYLVPYNGAADVLHARWARAVELTQDNPAQQADLAQLQKLADLKLEELRQTINLRRKSGLQAATAVVLGDRGQKAMDNARLLVDRMNQREEQLLQTRQEASRSTALWAAWTILGGLPLSLLAMGVAAIILIRRGRLESDAIDPSADGATWVRIALSYAFAVVAVALAGVARWWLILKFGPMPTFITFYPAVLLVAVVCGGGPGIVTAVLCALVADYWFIEPHGFGIGSLNDIIATAIFTGTNMLLCVVAQRLRRSRWAEAIALASQQEAAELAGKNEELAQQSEELSQQSEELTQQNEELQTQSEEIQSLNTELASRESMLQKLLEATRLPTGEETVLNDICKAAMEMFGPPASAVVVCQRQENELLIRACAGLPEAPPSWPVEGTFLGLVVQEGRTACINDASLRPDIKLLQSAAQEPFQAALASPFHVGEGLLGAVTIYSCQKQEWTSEQFRLAQWLAAQCGQVLETLRLQQQLAESAERNRFLSELLEHSDQPFAVVFLDGRLGRLNGAFERLTGYSREELAQIDWSNTLTPVQWRPLEQEKLDELHRTGLPVRYEKECLRKDGTRVPIELLAHLARDAAGRPLYYYCFVTDITQRKAAEELQARLAAIVESSDDAIVSKDLNGTIRTWNTGAERLFGYRAQEVIGRSITLLLPEDRVGEEDEILQQLRAGERVDRRETVRVAKDGRQIVVSVTASPVKDHAGRTVGASKIIHDITDLKVAHEDLRRAHDELELRVAQRTEELQRRGEQLRALASELTLAEQRERQRLAHVLHDDLQQLLVGARFRVQPLRRSADETVSRRAADVDDLLQQSIERSRSLTGELSPPILHQGGLAPALEWLVNWMQQKHGLTVELQSDEGAVPESEDMKVLLFQSVRELLFNAAKHAQVHTARVAVRRIDGSIRIMVADEGAGFDPAMLRIGGGASGGFGLFSIRERLDLMGGRMEIDSTPGHGSRFTLWAPLRGDGEMKVPAAPSSAAPASADGAGETRTCSVADNEIRVLLVDDHIVVRQGLARLLDEEGGIAVVGEASDGPAALDCVRQLRPDVVLMDINMPHMDGIEATQTIHAEHPDVRIIGLSMFAQEERADAMRKAGAAAYLSKSGPWQDLIAAIRASVDA
ncbi:MAG: PAS domain S-box protein [Planctomycetaceae bacterium]|nr:PAS domain S-box protein [Planctomycetaceae bacterium]